MNKIDIVKNEILDFLITELKKDKFVDINKLELGYFKFTHEPETRTEYASVQVMVFKPGKPRFNATELKIVFRKKKGLFKSNFDKKHNHFLKLMEINSLSKEEKELIRKGDNLFSCLPEEKQKSLTRIQKFKRIIE